MDARGLAVAGRDHLGAGVGGHGGDAAVEAGEHVDLPRRRGPAELAADGGEGFGIVAALWDEAHQLGDRHHADVVAALAGLGERDVLFGGLGAELLGDRHEHAPAGAVGAGLDAAPDHVRLGLHEEHEQRVAGRATLGVHDVVCFLARGAHGRLSAGGLGLRSAPSGGMGVSNVSVALSPPCGEDSGVPASERPRARPSQADLADPVRPARIVIADDDRLTRDLLASILRNAGHSVDAVEDGQAAVERVGQGGVDLVLLDVIMPRLSGVEACRLLKGMMTDSFLPVMLVTVKTDTASRVEGLRIGADDYVCKPFEEAELLARVANMLRIKRLHEQITQQKARFERLSVHDELTGLYNFRFLHTRLNEEFKRAERYHEPFACLLIDIDQLRAVNEAGGRPAGDVAIRRVADSIRRCVREVDVVARYGGEEFLVVLPSTHFAGSVVVAERVWREVSGRPYDVSDGERRSSLPAAEGDPPGSEPRWADGPRQLTVSIGVALYPSRDVRTKDALIRAAEAALAQAKREGGNRICVFQQQGFIYSPTFAPVHDGGSAPKPPVHDGGFAPKPPAHDGGFAPRTPVHDGGFAPKPPAREAPPPAPARAPQDGPPSTRAPRIGSDGPISTRAGRSAPDGPPSTRPPRPQDGPPSTRAGRVPSFTATPTQSDGPPSTRAPRPGPESWRAGPDSEGGRRGA